MALASPAISAGQTAPPAARRGAPPTAAKPAAPPAAAPAVTLEPGTYARFTTTKGEFTARLFDKDAPKTVANFIGLATGKKAWTDPRTKALVHRPLYNNTIFHRVIPNFMIQGGDPLGDGTGSAGYKLADEISSKYGHNKAGIMSMANSGPNTSSSQFFITVAPYPSLDGHYSIFGEIVEGLENVIAISQVPRSPGNNRPLTPVAIKTVRIETVP
jgi:peptidyl-prolyl cis-trans isomerase A (cyclophilin A)